MTATGTDRLIARLAAIRLLSLDCDGVLTDGGLYYAADGTELRRFDVRDGVGIKSLLAADIEVAVVTASRTPAIEHRARALGIRHCLTGIEAANAVLRSRDLPPWPLLAYPKPEPFAGFIERLMQRGRKLYRMRKSRQATRA